MRFAVEIFPRDDSSGRHRQRHRRKTEILDHNGICVRRLTRRNGHGEQRSRECNGKDAVQRATVHSRITQAKYR